MPVTQLVREFNLARIGNTQSRSQARSNYHFKRTSNSDPNHSITNRKDRDYHVSRYMSNSPSDLSRGSHDSHETVCPTNCHQTLADFSLLGGSLNGGVFNSILFATGRQVLPAEYYLQAILQSSLQPMPMTINNNISLSNRDKSTVDQINQRSGRTADSVQASNQAVNEPIPPPKVKPPPRHDEPMFVFSRRGENSQRRGENSQKLKGSTETSQNGEEGSSEDRSRGSKPASRGESEFEVLQRKREHCRKKFSVLRETMRGMENSKENLLENPMENPMENQENPKMPIPVSTGLALTSGAAAERDPIGSATTTNSKNLNTSSSTNSSRNDVRGIRDKSVGVCSMSAFRTLLTEQDDSSYEFDVRRNDTEQILKSGSKVNYVATAQNQLTLAESGTFAQNPQSVQSPQSVQNPQTANPASGTSVHGSMSAMPDTVAAISEPLRVLVLHATPESLIRHPQYRKFLRLLAFLGIRFSYPVQNVV
jgi:hypothetical protein